MVRNERAVLNMINNPDDLHHSDRGCRQLTANLLAAIIHSQPAIYAYVDIVHDHIMRLRFDKDHLPPRASFYRRSSAHTGLPDPPNSSDNATSSPDPTSLPCVSVSQVVQAKGLDKSTPQSYASVVAPPQPQTLEPNPDVRSRNQAPTLPQPAESSTTTSHPLRDPPEYDDSLFSFTDICYRTSTTDSTATTTTLPCTANGSKPPTKEPPTSTTKSGLKPPTKEPHTSTTKTGHTASLHKASG